MGDDKPITKSSLIRVAGNIASGFVAGDKLNTSTKDGQKEIAKRSVAITRLIVEELDKVPE